MNWDWIDDFIMAVCIYVHAQESDPDVDMTRTEFVRFHWSFVTQTVGQA